VGRRSRKRRPDESAPPPPAPGDTLRRGYARAEERNAAVRATLVPLAPGERPRPLIVAVVVAALLGLIVVVFALFLLRASNLLAVVLCLAVCGGAGWLFWKLVRVLGRMQAPERRAPPPHGQT